MATIASFAPFPIRDEKPGMYPGIFELRAATKTKPEFLEVHEASTNYYLQDGKALRVPVLEKQLAESVVRDFVDGLYGVSPDACPAIFVVDGKLNDEVISNALEKQERWMQFLVKDADDSFAKTGTHRGITKLHHMAAAYLNLQPENHQWLKVESRSSNILCEACGTNLKSTVVVCYQCGFVVNSEKYKTLQFAKEKK